MLREIQTNGHNFHGSPSLDCDEAYRLPQEPGWVHSIRSKHKLLSKHFGFTSQPPQGNASLLLPPVNDHWKKIEMNLVSH
jgi:hypothetical protein